MPARKRALKSDSSVPLLRPVVMRVLPEDVIELTDPDFSRLEQAGNISLTKKHRNELQTLADFWAGDLRLRVSARPKDVRKRLQNIVNALSRTQPLLRFDESDAPLERHVLHLMLNSAFEGASELMRELNVLCAQIDAVIAAIGRIQSVLPPDSGRARSFSDERRITSLSDIFEAAGGKAKAYTSHHQADGYADTAFRRFAQAFYSRLPGKKRKPKGLDEALREGMLRRKEQRQNSKSR
jgi:hypothetical protein